MRGLLYLPFLAIMISRLANSANGSFVNVNYQQNCSENYMKIDVEHYATENDFIFNLTAQHMVPLAEMKLLAAIAWPMNSNDANYQVELPKVSIDLCRLSRNVFASLFYKGFLESFMSCIEGGLGIKCPVSTIVRRCVNCKASNVPIPSMAPERKFRLTMSLVGKVVGAQRTVKICNFVVVGEYKK